ncbi:hypothetical protein [Actinomadura terrae]|uniref:hypothetical protein n=1 Tax=Actinomadura terrae TaxID=604353 RepID=UPI001FA77A4E|nr:hypothetical protein [Actinomadura terrae]
MLHRSFDRSDLIDPCTISLTDLCGGSQDARLLGRVSDFLACDVSLTRIASQTGDTLVYESESFVPAAFDPGKRSVFFVVGNPAPHSIAHRAMYAYEGAGRRQHRFWKVLHRTGMLRFCDADPDTHSPQEKMRRLFTGDFTSPFNISVLPLLSLPSPPGGPWGGVGGLQRLFGPHFPTLLRAERAAVNALLNELGKPGDTVVVMQKDAYTALRAPGTAPYDAAALRTQAIHARTAAHDLNLLCLSPTRLMYSAVTTTALTRLAADRLHHLHPAAPSTGPST